MTNPVTKEAVEKDVDQILKNLIVIAVHGYGTGEDVRPFANEIMRLIHSYTESAVREARTEELNWVKSLSTVKLFKDVGSEYHINARHIEFRLARLTQNSKDSR